MIKTKIWSTLVVLLPSLLLTACTTLAVEQDIEMTNLYQHRWINTSAPHVGQDIQSISEYLAGFDVVFFGELHEHPAVHLAQMQLFESMFRLNPQLSLSLEQFERDTQSYLDDYLAGKIGEKYLIKKARAWGNYTTSYRPLVEFSKHHQLPVVAANAPKETVVCVGRIGLEFLDTLSSQDRQHVAADIDVAKGAYRDKFMSFLTSNASHGNTSDNKMGKIMQQMSERSFAAQVVRDETMAESIVHHLQKNPQRQVLHLNGAFHSSQFLGTVERLSKRMPELKIAVIETVTVAVDDKSWITEELGSGNLLLLVKKLPVGFVKAENEREWSKSILKKRKKSGRNCKPLKQSSSHSG